MGQSTSTGGDVVDIIRSQHDQVKTLFSALAAAKGAAAEEAFCDVRRLLAVHETAEEEIVYPVLRSIGDQGRKIADARTSEEAEAKKLLAQLEDTDVDSAEFGQRFETFRRAVLDHAEHEEQEVLPLLREHQEPKQLETMAKAFKLAEKAAPTHPHPHGPTSAVGNAIVGPAVAIMDRVRDAIKGR